MNEELHERLLYQSVRRSCLPQDPGAAHLVSPGRGCGPPRLGCTLTFLAGLSGRQPHRHPHGPGRGFPGAGARSIPASPPRRPAVGWSRGIPDWCAPTPPPRWPQPMGMAGRGLLASHAPAAPRWGAHPGCARGLGSSFQSLVWLAGGRTYSGSAADKALQSVNTDTPHIAPPASL